MFYPQMSDDILPVPRIPDGLREAAQRGTLISLMATEVSLSCSAARYCISDVVLGG
jgi:hypothetical protein